MRFTKLSIRLSAVLLAFMISQTCVGQESSVGEKDLRQNTETQQPLWRIYSDAVIRQHEVKLVDDPETKIRLIENPVFIHNSSVKDEEHALVYLWVTDVGRPVAVVTAIVSRVGEGKEDLWDEVDEFHSFYDGRLVTYRDGASLWTPQAPGLTWKEIPDAPEPAETEAKQKLQSKMLARRFEFRAIFHREDGRWWNLRRIPTPIQQFSTDEDGQLVSGALLVFCRQTDPESILALEIRKNDRGKYRWHYAGANYSAAGTHLYLDGVEVWSEDPARFASNYRHFGYYPRRGIRLKEEIEKLKAK